MALMAVDHASSIWNANKSISYDTAWMGGVAPTSVPEYLTRWVSHLCAPTFVLLAGAAIAFSTARRRALGAGERAVDRRLVVRGLAVISLEGWLAISNQVLAAQVLWVLGAGMILMAGLRRLPAWVHLLVGAGLVASHEAVLDAVGVEASWTGHDWFAGLLLCPAFFPAVVPDLSPVLPWPGAPGASLGVICIYPLMPWMGVMMIGFAFGSWLRVAAPRPPVVAAFGVGLLALYALVKAGDGYGNGWIPFHDGALSLIQASKYPPSIAFLALELGIALLVVAGLMGWERSRPARENPARGLLVVLGQTPLLFYCLHMHVMFLAAIVSGTYREGGWPAAWIGAATTVGVLYPVCRAWRDLRRA